MRFVATLFLCVLAVPAIAQEPSYEARLGLHYTGRDPVSQWRWGSRAASQRPMRGAVLATYYDCKRPGQCSKSKRTASGERFNPQARTCAHPSARFGTILRVTHGDLSADCRVNDRGPAAWTGNGIDLTPAVAALIGLRGKGRVTIERM